MRQPWAGAQPRRHREGCRSQLGKLKLGDSRQRSAVSGQRPETGVRKPEEIGHKDHKKHKELSMFLVPCSLFLVLGSWRRRRRRRPSGCLWLGRGCGWLWSAVKPVVRDQGDESLNSTTLPPLVEGSAGLSQHALRAQPLVDLLSPVQAPVGAQGARGGWKESREGKSGNWES